MSESIKNVLFVDDEPGVLKGLQRMLRRYRDEWNMTFVDSGEAALQHLLGEPCDVIVTDMRMPAMDGSELLTSVTEQFPHVVRIILSGQANRDAVLRSVEPTHQYLAKPCNPDLLKSTVSRACQLREMLNNDELKTLLTQMKSVPSLPSVYRELEAALRDPDTPVTVVGAIIGRDIAMTAKLLKMVNSAYFGMAQEVTSSQQAVSMLGIDMVKALVLSVGVFSQFDQGGMDHFSLHEFEQHCHRVGNVAKAIAGRQTGDRHLAATAFTAAFMHDIGKLILISSRNDEYQEVVRMASENQCPLIESEAKAFGASHQAIGAYLLGIWGLPDDLVEAVRYHHFPSESKTTLFTPLTAVHAANVIDLSHDRPDLPLAWDLEYLTNLGLADQIPEWQEIAAEFYRKAEAC